MWFSQLLLTKQKSPQHPNRSALKLKTRYILYEHTHILEAPAKCNLGLTCPRPSPTALTQLIVGQSHVHYAVFFKISKKGLSTCFWVLFTVHRFVSSRVTVVAPSKQAQLNIQVTKARSGLPTACNGQLHQEAEGMPRATKSWLRTAGTPGVSACDNEARRGHASVNPSSQTAARLWFSPPTPLG